MIVLASDFRTDGPYVGQMHAAVLSEWPDAHIVHLAHDLPQCDPYRAAYLFAAYADWFPSGTTFVCVVDPGVGSDRRPIVVDAGGRVFIGPDNGLFEPLLRRALTPPTVWVIAWPDGGTSASFHGRDVFAPAAARIARDGLEACTLDLLQPVDPDSARRSDWPDDLYEIVHVDGFGNLVSGVRAQVVPATATITIGTVSVRRARTFSDVGRGQAFWYANSQGLMEVAVNQGNAAEVLRAGVGQVMFVSNVA